MSPARPLFRLTWEARHEDGEWYALSETDADRSHLELLRSVLEPDASYRQVVLWEAEFHLATPAPLSRQEARDAAMGNWSIRCATCGSYGATWLEGQPQRRHRPLALCAFHRLRYFEARDRLEDMLRPRFEQEGPDQDQAR